MSRSSQAIAFGLLAGATVVVTLALWIRGQPGRDALRAEELVSEFHGAALAGDSGRAESAYEALKELGAAAVPPSVILLGDQDEQTRELATQLIQGLIEEVRERDPSASVPPEVTEAIGPLVATLTDAHAGVRGKAVSSLGWIGPPAASAIPAIEKMLTDPDGKVRERAERALHRIRTGALE